MKVEQFLKEYSDILCDEHKEEIEMHYHHLTSYGTSDKVKSKFGEHYTSCPWSSDDAEEGPDTCECYDRDKCIKRLAYLLNFYKCLKEKRNCLSCFGKKCDF